ncbi:unnamed protein product [Adineta steineri]|uniref:Asn/Gln amidotransferase domain-containing protein n=1 Tax=Adineta steineri TaxID=433720 RepID=A0A813ZRT8_9BILA|nr:unnamed protein product [Adineta steineri]
MTVVLEQESMKSKEAFINDNSFSINNIQENLKLRTNERNDQNLQTDLLDTSTEMSSFNPCRMYCKCSTCFILSCITFVMGLIMLFTFDPMVNKIIANKMAIIEGREGHQFWKNPPAEIHRKMYIWHCANPIEVQNGGIPDLIERGPYVYREQWNRSNIFYNDDLSTLSYIPITTLYFDRNQSVGPDDVYVTVINVPLMAMAHEIQFNSSEIQKSINIFLHLFGTKLFVNVTVKDLMEGYTDPLIEMASLVKPGSLKDNKFGILQPRNGSYYQNFTINTGYNDITEVAKVISFNGVQRLNYWSTPQANMFNGTDGSLFPPHLNKNKDVYSYNADMCRSYYLSFLREKKDGYVTLYDYHLSSNVFNMSREENRGFCGQGSCLGDGDYFRDVMNQLDDNRLRHIALEVILNDVKSISYDGRKIRKFAQAVSPSLFADIIKHVDKRIVTRFSLYTLLTLCNKNRDSTRPLKSFLDEHNMYAITDENELEKICLKILEENPKTIDRYKTNPKKALEQLHSITCKKHHGRIHDDIVNDTFKHYFLKNMSTRLNYFRMIFPRYHSTKPTPHQQNMMARGLPKRTPIDGVQHVIAVGSGKGGVGKSSVSVNLALALSRLSYRVGILDADIFGPSIPTLLNLRNHKATTLTKTNLIEPLINFNLKCMSIAFLTKSDGPVVWRGLMVMQAIEKLLRQIAWSPLDYLIVDLPPGTGDIQLSLAQLIPLSGVLMVTTPQELSLVDVRKAIEMFRLVQAPILGIVENFSTYFCQKCGHEEKIFGENGGESLGKEYHLKILQSLPIDIYFRQACDEGRPISEKNDTILWSKFNNLANEIVKLLPTDRTTII